ncbi:MAG: hypothetical protein IKA67_04260, partial [Clostridia bacterium]|nr:hypothetical protein [Clostridia bacterium]
VLGGNKAPETPNTPETPAEKTYTLSIVVDEGLGSVNARGKATAIALALVYDADGKIVAARFESIEPGLALNADKTDLLAVDRVETKVEKGDAYTGMSDSWKDEAAAFEKFLIGKTAAEVAALQFVVDGEDAGLVAGCTMKSSMPVFQALVAEAFAYTRNVTFKTTATDIKLGLAVDTKVSGSVEKGASIAADFAAVAIVDGKVAAAMLDSAEAKYTLAIAEEKLTATLKEYKGTKNEQGDAYDSYSPMAGGRWYAQAQAFANALVGKTAAEVEAIDASAVAGCTIYAGGYKAALVRALGYAR